MNPLAITKNVGPISRLPVRVAPRPAPTAEEINDAFAALVRKTVPEMIRIGQMLREKRAELCAARPGQANQHTPAEQLWSAWFDAHCHVPKSSAHRWMGMAENSIKCAWLPVIGQGAIDAGCIEVDAVTISFSQILSLPEAELPEPARQARQLMFDFASGKTQSDILTAAAYGDSAPGRIASAHAGQAKGGAGGDRKDYPAHIKRHIDIVTTHLTADMEPDQQAIAATHLVNFAGAAPQWVLKTLAAAIKEELKMSEADRAIRNEEKAKG